MTFNIFKQNKKFSRLENFFFVYLKSIIVFLFNFVIEKLEILMNFFIKKKEKSIKKKNVSTSKFNFSENIISTLKITEISDHLRFNPFILKGYRNSNLSFKKSVLSFFYFHNETANIYSHTLALFYFTCVMPKKLPWNEISKNNSVYFLALNYIFATNAPWIGSIIYHLFMSHKDGIRLYNKLLKLDVIGIWIIQTFGAVLPIFSSLTYLNSNLQILFILCYGFLSLRCLYDVFYVGGIYRRRLGFFSLVIMRLLALWIRKNKINHSVLIDLLLIEVYPIIGAFLTAFRIPEKYFPGKFDFFLNSHNIMHLLVFFGALHLQSSAINDFYYLANYFKTK